MILVILVDGVKAFVGKAENGQYVAQKEVGLEPGKRPDLLREVSNLISPPEIEGIIVFGGPGAFTSLRVAVAVANALSYALGVPIAGVEEETDPAVLLRKGLEKLKENPRDPVIPFYKKAPNITKPKK